jgi:hypothetical protein
MRAGTAKRSRLIPGIQGKTLDHRRLFTSGLLYRFTDATAGKNFAPRTLGKRRFSVLIFLRVRQRNEAPTPLRAWQFLRLVVRFPRDRSFAQSL